MPTSKTKRFSVCAVLRPTRSSDESTIHYRIRLNSSTKLLSTHLRIPTSQWDGSLPVIPSLRDRINTELYQLRQLIKDALVNPDSGYPDSNDIIKQFRDYKSGITLRDYMNLCIDNLLTEHRFGTARNYRCTLQSILSFCNNTSPQLADINARWLDEYRDWLGKRHVTTNTISFYMRILRAIVRRAQKQELIPISNPFREIFTGNRPTAKRAISIRIIRQLINLDLQNDADLLLARDIFLFSLMTRGMSFVDIAYLSHENIKGDSLIYRRRKTGILINIKIEPPIREILNRYHHPKRRRLFPLIEDITEEIVTDPKEEYDRYKRAEDTFNRRLRRLGRMIDSDLKLTSYVARHTWASLQQQNHVPLSVISAALGHRSERTTQIYLSGISDTEVNDANRHLLRTLLSPKTNSR